MDINEILNKSRAVMNQVESSPRKIQASKQVLSESYYSDDEKPLPIENTLFNTRLGEQSSPIFSENVAKNSKLPKEVIEAMRGESKSKSSTSFLDNVELPKKIIVENKKIDTERSSNVGIDYSLIQNMIEEASKKQLHQIKKSILTESKTTNSGLSMMTKQGNKFRFVTEDGKIFEANLVYKGNLNEK